MRVLPTLTCHPPQHAVESMMITLKKWEASDTLRAKLQEPRTRLPLDGVNARVNAFACQLRAVFRLKKSSFSPESVIPEGDALRFWIMNFGHKVRVCRRRLHSGGGGGSADSVANVGTAHGQVGGF